MICVKIWRSKNDYAEYKDGFFVVRFFMMKIHRIVLFEEWNTWNWCLCSSCTMAWWTSQGMKFSQLPTPRQDIRRIKASWCQKPELMLVWGLLEPVSFMNGIKFPRVFEIVTNCALFPPTWRNRTPLQQSVLKEWPQSASAGRNRRRPTEISRKSAVGQLSRNFTRKFLRKTTFDRFLEQ